jgi:glycosyltransferase involved in cell wall biosynthesis
MKILFAVNYTAQSSYANVARSIAPRLVRAGHEVVIAEIGGSGNLAKDVGGITVLPPAGDPLLNSSIAMHAQRFGADVILSMTDIWGLLGARWREAGYWAHWIPIDHTPVPPAVFHSAQHAHSLLAMSRFGQEQLDAVGLASQYVPLGFERSRWFPMNRAECREAVGIDPDTFLAVFVGVNDSVPSRKGIPELLAAWKLFSREVPRSKLFMHTSRDGNRRSGEAQGVDILTALRTFRIDETSVLFPDEYKYRTGFSGDKLRILYNAADVFVLPTRGEGFGLPILEAQACGTPVLTTDCAGGAELVAPTGAYIDGELEWTRQSATVIKPGISSIFERLLEARAWMGDVARREATLQWIQRFEYDTVFETFVSPALVNIAKGVLNANSGLE